MVTVNDYTRDHDFTGALAVLTDLGEPQAPYTRLDPAGRSEAAWVDLRRLREWFEQRT